MAKLAHKIGSLLFCPDCGTLLNLPRDEEIQVTCEQCEHREPASSYENTEIVTHSHPDAFPSALLQKRKTQTKIHEGDAALLKVCVHDLILEGSLILHTGHGEMFKLWTYGGLFEGVAGASFVF